MKRFLLAMMIMVVAAFAFARQPRIAELGDDNGEPMDTTVQVIVPEDMHTTNKTAQVRIEYTASVDEVRIYYTCLEVSFKESEARETIHQCLNDFQLSHQYYGYKYMGKSRTTYKKNARKLKQATYMEHVQFQR